MADVAEDTPSPVAYQHPRTCHSCRVAREERSPALDYIRGKIPLYTVAQAARILGVKSTTFDTWVNGYERHPAGRKPVYGAPMVTRLPVAARGPSVPFVGLAEGYFLAAMRQSGVPLPAVRRAVEFLEREIGLEHALANKQVFALGGHIVYDWAKSNGVEELMELVEIDQQTGQGVFVSVVRDYLRGVELDDDGWASRLTLRSYKVAVILVEPEHTSGQPYFASSGVPVADVVNRAFAGDPVDLLAADYGMDPREVEEAVKVAGPRAA